MDESIHTARWISHITNLGWDLHLFSSTDNGPVNSKLENVKVYRSFSYPADRNNPKIQIFGHYLPSRTTAAICRRFVKTIDPNYRRHSLKKLIENIKPDIIHSMEFQSAGYQVMSLKREFSYDFPVWIATNWGSDIYHFMKDPVHLPKIKEILFNCDYYSCECNRDVKLAISLGLKSKILPVIPNAGGFDLDTINLMKSSRNTSSRRLILLKGYQGWAGRGLIGLAALKLCQNELWGYKIGIFSASPDVIKAANRFSKETGIPVEIIPPSPHDHILNLLGQARIYIGLSISDAISTSLLESMVMGTFPIQSGTSCANEWIIDGVSGFIVPPEDVTEVAVKIKKAINDDILVDRASRLNYDIIKERLDKKIIDLKIKEIYEKIYHKDC
jgi:hypothetical protein